MKQDYTSHLTLKTNKLNESTFEKEKLLFIIILHVLLHFVNSCKLGKTIVVNNDICI